MQSYKEDELFKTQQGTIDKLAEAMKNDKESTHHVIGKIPKVGKEFTLNGLIYKVISVNPFKGIFISKIKGE